MSDRYRLVEVGNSELLTNVSRLVRRGNEITAEVLAHLAEIEDRMLHLELGFPSLFAYCVEALRMSEGAAGRRVAAARVCRRFPEALALVASGELHLSAVCAAAQYLEPSNAMKLLEACRQKTRRQVDELLADQFPKVDVREQVRRLRSQEIEPLGGERFGVHFTADSELRELIERARAIASHRFPDGDLAGLMKLAFAQFVKNEEGRRFAVGRKPRQSTTKIGGAISATPARSVTVSAKLAPSGEGLTAQSAHRTHGAAVEEPPGAFQRIAKIGQGMDDEMAQDPHGGAPDLVASAARGAGAATAERAYGDFELVAPRARADDDLAQDARGPTAAMGRDAIKRSMMLSHEANQIPAKLAMSAIKGSTPPGGVRRWVRAAVRREVYARDDGRCSFVAADGRRCAARGRLELDHIEPWARRGAAEGDNLRLRCRAHNALHARHCFGAEHVAAKIAARRMGAR